MKTKVSSNGLLVYHLAEPLNGASNARVDIHCDDGNLAVDPLSGSEPLLAAGELEYFVKQGEPSKTVNFDNGLIVLTIHARLSGKAWFRLPWAACNGAHEWQVHLSPSVALDLTAFSGGGNVKVDLNRMNVSKVSAETGGGNIDIILPEARGVISAIARTGAGNVSISLPEGMEARILATTGLGKAIVDSRFIKVDKNIYQSSGYDSSDNKVDITAHSGAGNVIVSTR